MTIVRVTKNSLGLLLAFHSKSFRVPNHIIILSNYAAILEVIAVEIALETSAGAAVPSISTPISL